MTTITIRDARPDERSAIAALTRTAYDEYATIMDPDAWAGLSGAVDAALASDDHMERIVAEHEGMLIGSVLLYPPSSKAYSFTEAQAAGPELRLLAVAPAWRGKGVAQRLVDECVRRARAMGAPDLGLHTSRSMRGAMRLYERMGFVRVPERDFRPPGAEVVEGYRLPLR
jgi:predicted N-acetyltransferase YhbS